MLLRRKGLFLQKRALSDVRSQEAGIKQLSQKEKQAAVREGIPFRSGNGGALLRFDEVYSFQEA